MRTYILRARRAPTGADYIREDLAQSGHLEIVCHCIMNSLWIAGHVREDTVLHVVCEGPPTPPITLTFTHELNSHYSEKALSTAIKEALLLVPKLKREECKKAQNGILVSKKGFENLIKEIEVPIFYLHPKGEAIDKADLIDDICIVLGDHKGIPKQSEKFLKRYATGTLTFGKQMRFASQCVTIAQYELDKK